jgi:hypothetical protein
VAADEGQQLRVAVTGKGSVAPPSVAYSERTNGVKAGGPAAPNNTALPVITGEARDRSTLAGTVGFWGGNPTGYQYQWLRCATAAGGECNALPGATSLTYAVSKDDVGATLRLLVTAENAIGSTTVESAPTGIVQPFVLKASFALPTTPVCTGTPVALDASSSVTPNPPILSYRWDVIKFSHIVYAGLLFGGFEAIDGYINTLPAEGLVTSTAARSVVTFTYNRLYEDPTIYDDHSDSFLGGKPGEWVRDDVRIILTVRDKAGDVASTSHDLLFAQTFSNKPRTACPKFLTSFNPSAPLKLASQWTTTTTTTKQTIRCASALPCAGTLSLTTPRALLAATAAGKVPKGRVIASDRYFTIPAHRTATVRLQLTRLGRSLLRRRRTLPVLVHLTSIGVTGKTSTKVLHVTLRRR